MDHKIENLDIDTLILDLETTVEAQLAKLGAQLAKLEARDTKNNRFSAKVDFKIFLEKIKVNLNAHIRSNRTHSFSISGSLDEIRNIPNVLRKLQNVYAPDCYQITLEQHPILKGKYNLAISYFLN